MLLHLAIAIQQFLGSLCSHFRLGFRETVCCYEKDHSVPFPPFPTCARWKHNLMHSSPTYKSAVSVPHGPRYVKMDVKLSHGYVKKPCNQ